jgi:hypothetical protein
MYKRVFNTIFSQMVVELGEVCNRKTYSEMIAGKDSEFECMSHGSKAAINCSAIDYCLHTLETDMYLF